MPNPTRTSYEKCNSKASGWELNPRPWISRPTLYRLSYTEAVAVSLGMWVMYICRW